MIFTSNYSLLAGARQRARNPAFAKGLIISLVLSFTLRPAVLAQKNYGILFKSYEYHHHERTSLDLTAAGPLMADQSSELSFALAFWDTEKFGYIFRSILTNETKLDLVYMPDVTRGPLLKVILNEEETGLQLSLPDSGLLRNQWHNLKLAMDSGSILLNFDGESVAIKHDKNKTAYQSLVFGVNYQPQNQTIEAAHFALREVAFKADNKIKHHWPLYGVREGTALDQVNAYHGTVKNAIWLTLRHFSWQKFQDLKTIFLAPVAFNPVSSKLLIDNRDYLLKYDVNRRTLDRTDYSRPMSLPDPAMNLVYHEGRGQLVAFDLEPRDVVVYDQQNNEWSVVKNDSLPSQNYWLSSVFINPLNNNLMTLGGYGFFEQKNHLLSYDFQKNSWDKVPLKGDTLIPRYQVAIGEGFRNGSFFVFGGIGNESGKQELGNRNLYDFFLLDLNDSSLTKIWELSPPQKGFVPMGNIISNPADSTFHVLCYQNYERKNDLALVEFSINRPDYKVVSDSIPFSYERLDLSVAGVFKNAPTSELIAYTRNSDGNQGAIIRLYSLFYPPGFTPQTRMATGGGLSPWLAALLVVMLSLGGVILYRLRQKNLPGRGLAIKNTAKPTANAIYIFGGFTVIDSGGNDVSNNFSAKLRELFLFILITNLRTGKGVSTAQINQAIWPDFDAQKAKNSRGVTMQRLKGAIEVMDGVALSYADNLWSIDLSPGVYCDYREFLRIKAESLDEDTIEQLLEVLKRGKLLRDLQGEWLEKIQSGVTNEITDHLVASTQIRSFANDNQTKLKIADTILIFDDLNDHALALKVSSLTSLGKHGLAKSAYDQFCQRYKRLYDEPYFYDFKRLMTLTKNR